MGQNRLPWPWWSRAHEARHVFGARAPLVEDVGVAEPSCQMCMSWAACPGVLPLVALSPFPRADPSMVLTPCADGSWDSPRASPECGRRLAQGDTPIAHHSLRATS